MCDIIFVFLLYVHSITNYILCDYYLLLQYAMYGEDSLENKITQKGVVSGEGLCHEYEGPVS